MIILDTNVASELMRPDVTEIEPWLTSIAPASVFITVVTRAEIRYGIERLPAGARRRALVARADAFFESVSDRILPFESAAADRYGELIAARDAAGRPMSVLDGQIAAIALVHRATVATRNLRDFEGIGLTLVDPWGAHE